MLAAKVTGRLVDWHALAYRHPVYAEAEAQPDDMAFAVIPSDFEFLRIWPSTTITQQPRRWRASIPQTLQREGGAVQAATEPG